MMRDSLSRALDIVVMHHQLGGHLVLCENFGIFERNYLETQYFHCNSTAYSKFVIISIIYIYIYIYIYI